MYKLDIKDWLLYLNFCVKTFIGFIFLYYVELFFIVKSTYYIIWALFDQL